MSDKVIYCDRVWLNPADRRATGSIVAYHGPNAWKDEEGNYCEQYVLEIADCNNKVAIHKSDGDSLRDFINKLKLLESTIHEFVAHLEELDEPF